MLNKIKNTKQLQENGSKSITLNAQGCSCSCWFQSIIYVGNQALKNAKVRRQDIG
jgi:hypothetical protein